MTKPTYVLVAHMCHDAPWLQIRTLEEVRERRSFIKTHKPEREHALRLKLLKTIKKPLPAELQNVYAALVMAHAALVMAHVAWDKADAAWWKADAEWDKVINSREGVAFHQQVCGCAWTPEQPDILLQLKEPQ